MLEVILENIATIATMVTTIVGLVAAVLVAIKQVAAKNASEALATLTEACTDAVVKVEAFKTEIESHEKLRLALNYTMQACNELGVSYNEEKATEIVEKIITLTKTVNYVSTEVIPE